MVEYKLNIDTRRRDTIKPSLVKQGDSLSTKLSISLFNHGEEISLDGRVPWDTAIDKSWGHMYYSAPKWFRYPVTFTYAPESTAQYVPAGGGVRLGVPPEEHRLWPPQRTSNYTALGPTQT